MKRNNRKLSIIESFDKADELEKRELWNMTPIQRLGILEKLRSIYTASSNFL